MAKYLKSHKKPTGSYYAMILEKNPEQAKQGGGRVTMPGREIRKMVGYGWKLGMKRKVEPKEQT